jgi:hypothetical protein
MARKQASGDAQDSCAKADLLSRAQYEEARNATIKKFFVGYPLTKIEKVTFNPSSRRHSIKKLIVAVMPFVLVFLKGAVAVEPMICLHCCGVECSGIFHRHLDLVRVWRLRKQELSEHVGRTFEHGLLGEMVGRLVGHLDSYHQLCVDSNADLVEEKDSGNLNGQFGMERHFMRPSCKKVGEKRRAEALTWYRAEPFAGQSRWG